MSAYYNEHDEYAVEWLGNLIARRCIAPGVVDGRSIKEVVAADVRGATQAHFFSGIGVWSHALRLAGWPEDVGVWTGSCPCQPFSAAGLGLGEEDERHLWPDWFPLIEQCRPACILGEQVASPAGLEWFDAVHADLAGAGYTVWPADLCAASAGAPHVRQRLYFVAFDPERLGELRSALANSAEQRRIARWWSSVASDGGAQARLEPRRLREAGGLAHANGFSRHEGSEIGGGGDCGGDARPWAGFGSGGSACGLANADSEQRRLHVQPGSARRAFLEALGRGEAGELGDSDKRGSGGNAGAAPRAHGGASGEGLQSWAQRDAAFASGTARFMGDAGREGLAGRTCEPGDDGSQLEASQRAGGAACLVVDPAGLGWGQGGRDAAGGRTESSGREAAFDGDASATRGFWADAAWIYCRDGKWRPVESEYVAMAPRSAEDLGRVRTEKRAVWPLTVGEVSRVGRIKGYGNAIVGPLAAAFIRAFMDVVTMQ